ncbi:hypothetical protein [Neptuniibacter sp. QD37_11]|uniref:DUF5983 family protein n=1 Tax=Neptuniibacter sp. QD37_11 TaxID=3398209 RepID=UPI0039F5A535
MLQITTYPKFRSFVNSLQRALSERDIQVKIGKLANAVAESIGVDDANAAKAVLERQGEALNRLAEAEHYSAIALSSAHLTTGDHEFLFKLEANDQFDTDRVIHREWGYMFKLCREGDTFEEMNEFSGVLYELSAPARKILRDAWEAGIMLVEFDAHVDEVEGYDTF